MKKKISIITPTFNEAENIEKLCEEISKEMNISYGWVRSLLYRAESLVEKFPKYQKSQKSIQLILKKYPLKFRKKKAA